jgi:hypothetical protein
LPKRASTLCLRSHVLTIRPRAPHSNVDALAEMAAREAAAGMLNGRIERRRMHGAIVSAAARGEQ